LSNRLYLCGLFVKICLAVILEDVCMCVYVCVSVCVCVGAQGGKGGNITTTCRIPVINDWHRRRTSVKDNNCALYIIQDGRVEKFLQRFSYLYIIIRIHVKLRVKCVHRFAMVSFFTFRVLYIQRCSIFVPYLHNINVPNVRWTTNATKSLWKCDYFIIILQLGIKIWY